MRSPALPELLDPSLPHAAVEGVVRRNWKAHERSSARLAVGLRRLYRDQEHRGRDLERFPKILAAMDAGEIGYTKVREFIREATPETESFWLDFARRHTNREIEREIAKRHGTEPKKKVRVELSAEEQQDLRRAKEKAARAGAPPASDEQFVKSLVKMAATGQPEPGLFDQASADEDGKTPAKPAPPRPWLSIGLCASCLDTWVPVPGEDLAVPIERWLEELAAGAEVVDLLDHFLCGCGGDDGRHRRDRCTDSALLEGPPATSRHVPAAVQRIVEARDGFRCRTPGCRNTHPLDFSHLRDFAAGTPMTPEFLAQHCRACNEMIASGALVVRRTAPYEEYFDRAGNRLGIGYDPASRRPGVSHGGNGTARRDPSGNRSGSPPRDPPEGG